MADFLTPIFLGFIGGITPGPIILLAFSEVLKDSKKGLVNGSMYLIFAGLTEFLIGLFLIITSKSFNFSPIIFHLLSVLGIILLSYIAIKMFGIQSINTKMQTKNITKYHIVGLMLVNGPLWIFWLSVCLPAAFKLGQRVDYGEFLFLFIFELSMMMGLAIMLIGFNSCRKYFTNKKIIKSTFKVITLLLFLFILKMIYSEAMYFFELLKN